MKGLHSLILKHVLESVSTQSEVVIYNDDDSQIFKGKAVDAYKDLYEYFNDSVYSLEAKENVLVIRLYLY